MTDSERRLGPYCPRAEPRHRAMASRRGLLSPAERQHSGPLAEVSGDATPSGLPHGWRWALWNAEAVRDARRLSMVEPLGVPEAGLGIEATGCVKKRASGGRHAGRLGDRRARGWR